MAKPGLTLRKNTRILSKQITLAGNKSSPTCYRIGMAAALASGDKDDIALARVDIVVLQNEELVDAVLLERRDLDDDSDWPD